MRLIVALLLAALAASCNDQDFSGAAARQVEKEKPVPAIKKQKKKQAKKSETAGKKKAKEPPADVPERDIETADDILELCESGEVVAYSQTLAFEKVDRTNDPALSNIEIGDSLHQAMNQTKTVDLPAGAIVCSFKFVIRDTLKFDDEIFVALNGRLLFTSFDVTAKLEQDEGLYKLDWNKIRGTYYDGDVPSSTPPYCLWSGVGGANCKVGTKGSSSNDQNTATFAFDPSLSPETAAQLSLLAMKDDEIKFDLLTVEEGDDCYHEAFSMEVSGTYILKKD